MKLARSVPPVPPPPPLHSKNRRLCACSLSPSFLWLPLSASLPAGCGGLLAWRSPAWGAPWMFCPSVSSAGIRVCAFEVCDARVAPQTRAQLRHVLVIMSTCHACTRAAPHSGRWRYPTLALLLRLGRACARGSGRCRLLQEVSKDYTHSMVDVHALEQCSAL